MAEGGAENITPAEETDCPVCREDFKDPRSLTCGHHFCRGCLEGILRDSLQCVIKCPTCREETKVTQGSGVKGLHRPYLETLQEKIAGYLSTVNGQDFVKNCDVCKKEEVVAKEHCFSCRLNLCQLCLETHQQRTSSHTTAPVTESLFCRNHRDATVNLYCNDCSTAVCGLCVFHDHADHHTINIETVAEQSRQRLQEFITGQSGEDKNEVTLGLIRRKMGEAQKLQTEFKESVSETRRLLKELENKVNEVERDTNEKLTADIKTLTLYESDLKDFIDSRQSLVEYATYLTNTASNPELVEKEKEFPVTKFCGIRHIVGATVELSVVDKKITSICSQLQLIITDFSKNLEKTHATQKPKIGDLKKKHTVSLSQVKWVGGLTVDIKKERFIARTTDSVGPLKGFSYDGQLVETLGTGVCGLANCSNWKGVALDTKRDLFLAPCRGTLVLVDRAGIQQQSISVGGQGNSGVAYHEQVDLYFMSEVNNHTMYLVNPTTAQVTHQFGSQGPGPTHFSFPYNIHVGTVACVGRPCIIVSDNGNHCIKLLDISGNHVKIYGTFGKGELHLHGPWAVCTDREGRVIVCDRDNNRVVSYSTDSAGQQHWESLLIDDWGGSKPWHLALDTDNVTLGIVDGNKTLHIYT